MWTRRHLRRVMRRARGGPPLRIGKPDPVTVRLASGSRGELLTIVNPPLIGVSPLRATDPLISMICARFTL